MAITLTKALKLKNRLVQRISKIDGDIVSYNSRAAGSEQLVDVRSLYDKRIELVKKLIELKRRIIAANDRIWNAILSLAETKSAIVLWQKVPVRDGKTFVEMGFRNTEVLEYKAEYKKQEVDRLIAALEEQVDDLQEKIDQHNYSTTIEFEMVED